MPSKTPRFLPTLALIALWLALYFLWVAIRPERVATTTPADVELSTTTTTVSSPFKFKP
jgi:hypothetical protein